MFLACQVFTVLLLVLLLEGVTRLVTTHITPVDINAQTLISDRGREPFFEQHPFAAYTWIPHARFGRQTVNADGFVSTRPIPMEKEAAELRVVALGGSSTVGNGNADEETYPRILEALLRTRFRERTISVINAAAGGYSTIESLGYLQTRMVGYRPDVLLVMHGWNDMYYFTRTDREIAEWRKNLNLQAMWNPTVAAQMKDPLPAAVQYLSWSQLYLHLGEWVRRSRLLHDQHAATGEVHPSRRPTGLKPINPTAIELYRANLEQIKNVCIVRKIRCYAILQPTLVARGVDRNHPKLERAKTLFLHHGFDLDTHVAVFQQLYRINREVFGDAGIVDTTSMNGDGALFFDHVHQNAEGTKRLAALVFRNVAAAVGAGPR